MTRNDYKHKVVIIYRDDKVEQVMGLSTFRNHTFYQKLVSENIAMTDLNECGDNLFEREVSGKRWSRQSLPSDTQESVFDMFGAPAASPVYTFHFSWLCMDVEEVDKYKRESWHDEN